jgi:hypothetical protein
VSPNDDLPERILLEEPGGSRAGEDMGGLFWVEEIGICQARRQLPLSCAVELLADLQG